ncbi:Peroxisomal targeting signal receptor [Psilocybe cubensis]|uniref:Peroxisomal targeting signal receptor n=2 Tax=Psilocybe cubensis TaxID=181762 RepID=A0ACB8HBL2_PSICU|nr:Peroxisomal targeting signal receptor [Psilocybe cubensis]KAH9485130.1 Peroxisomal targeting signal receptor [Psilocybe cubensis]
MALPMLVGGGAECGPSNPLQNLSKRFEQDRGIQQDHFGAGRAGSSREVFRSQPGNTSAHDQDAARFFAANPSHAPQLVADAGFDLSSMRAALPMHPVPQMQMQAPQNAATASWASDFMAQSTTPIAMQSLNLGQPMQTAAKGMNMDVQVDHQLHPMHAASSTVLPPQAGGMQWNPTLSNFRMSNSMPAFMPQMPMQHLAHQPQPAVTNKRISWDREFSAQELQHTVSTPVVTQIDEPVQEQIQRPGGEADELARTAGMLLENVRHEQNPKFQKSQFMGLMKQLRDGEVIVEGNQMVESEGRTSSQANIDLKGKGRAVPIVARSMNPSANETVFQSSLNQASSNQEQQQVRDQAQEDANDAYFRQENAEFARYWSDTQVKQQPAATAETQAWGKLQADWDQFEATTSGIKVITNYRFQENNPYLLGDSSRTRAHLLHTQGRQSVLESVLELEACVLRNMQDASAWYELGVKQQENEREHKALQALRRAVELDPTHLPAWLALGISSTNDNDRQGTYDAINEWVSRNEQYQDAVAQFRAQASNPQDLTLAEKYSQLIQCLITMARSNTSGEIDADIQIALAVLLNTNEEYGKAQDCFRTALAVRPDDWLLYNRVGATMANSGRAEEALDYYYRALELNPGYIRARFNLGISCINLRRYEEAAQHILDALALQDSDGVRDDSESHENRGVVSSALWDSLKTTCLHMQRADLATLCDLKDLEGFRNRFHHT